MCGYIKTNNKKRMFLFEHYHPYNQTFTYIGTFLENNAFMKYILMHIYIYKYIRECMHILSTYVHFFYAEFILKIYIFAVEPSL
jgi:hypothetical protein